jgi:hypothetical protein
MHFTIVSYTFPPLKEIGGRRWAKFSQQLANKGHNVTVVCAGNTNDRNWYQKEFPSIKIIALPKSYPNWLTGNTNSLLEKLLYFVFTKIFKHITKQNLFDKGFAWKNHMLNALESIHNTNAIDVLIVTGAPFSLLYYGSEFKNKYKEVKYVADFRDPWTWGSYYGIPDLSLKQMRYQEHSELNTIMSCDLVSYPTEFMGDFLKTKYSSYLSKMYLLPHAYDPDKFPITSLKEQRSGFIYGGTLYDGIEKYLYDFSKIVKINNPLDFEWNIYTGTKHPLIDSNFANGKVIINELIPEDELFLKIKKSAAYLAFFPETDKDLVSTKFFEIVYSGTPILYIGEEGEVGRFIRENRLGVHILPKNMYAELPQYLNGNVPFEHGYFDVSKYSFSNVTKAFLEKLQNNKGN